MNLGDDHSYATTNSEVEDDDHKTQTDMVRQEATPHSAERVLVPVITSPPSLPPRPAPPLPPPPLCPGRITPPPASLSQADDGSDGKSLLQFIISASKQDVEMIGFLKRTGDYPDLSEPSSCGNSPAYLAILHDRPEVLRILNEFDVDLAEPCDAVKFATPSYYCAYLGRTECLRMLAKCEVELETSSCNKVSLVPSLFWHQPTDPPNPSIASTPTTPSIPANSTILHHPSAC